MYINKKNYFINIDISANNYGMYLTNHKKINPLEAPNFCMVLRKYLENAKIKNIHARIGKNMLYWIWSI